VEQFRVGRDLFDDGLRGLVLRSRCASSCVIFTSSLALTAGWSWISWPTAARVSTAASTSSSAVQVA
jgi:hypothetical protein